MKISIIIPNWNGAEKMKRHLPSVLEAARFSKAEEVIVTDDASTDNSLEVLKKQFSEVKVVKKEKNEGFSSNVNFGVNHAQGDVIVLLNSDASPQKDFLKAALPHFKNPKVFSVGCNVGGLWATGKFENGFFWHGQAELQKGEKMQAHRTLWASGGSGIFRKSIWDELGGLDPLYNPFYEEDVDLGYRATKRGYINIWEPQSIVSHYKEPGVISLHFSQKHVSSIAQRNQLIFIWKNITSQKLFAEHKKALVKMLISHPKYTAVFFQAFKKLPAILPKRQKEKRESILQDEQIFEMFNYSKI